MSTELNLYAIENEYLQLSQQILEQEGEVTDEQFEALAINRENLEVKLAKYSYVTKKWDGEIDLLTKEIERLTELKNARKKANDKMEATIKKAMEMFGVTKIESQNIKLLLVESKETIIDDQNSLPKKYLKKKITYSPDKTAIKNDINAGKKIKGARIQTNKNLRIS